MTATCTAHHWLLERPTHPTPATCKHCGLTRVLDGGDPETMREGYTRSSTIVRPRAQTAIVRDLTRAPHMEVAS